MFRRLALSALGACLLFAAQSAVASPAEAAVRCVAVAERINGARVPSTRTAVERRREARACNIAINICEEKLHERRFITGRPMPFARCNVVRVRHVGYAGPSRGYYPAPPPRYDGPGYCNFSACAHRYRSFRASDCTFQPYHGPRKYCRL
jgi:hypothetical protein